MNTKEIIGYEGYFISDTGDVYSTKRGGFKKRKLTPDKNGYSTITLSPDGGVTKKTLKIHRVVAQAFIKSCIAGFEVNHLNGIKDDNRVCNLELVRHKENMQHASVTNLLCRGESRPANKHTEEQIREVCRLLQDTKLYLREISEITGVTIPMCNSVYYRKKWKYISKDYDFSKNKRKRGSQATLDESSVVKICDLLNLGLSIPEVVKETGVSYHKIAKIKYRKSYLDITSQYLHEAPTTIESTPTSGSE